ncbi:MAG: molybdopterin-guanine dinucleotide biosynthesis protein B [Burkholderiales bacterium]
MRVMGVAGWSNSGKTTLLEQVLPRIVAAGVGVSMIKHAHHLFDVDKPGKDSYRHRHAGAMEVMISSENRWALMHELRGEPEPGLDALLANMSPVDLVLVEGFKRYEQPKIEVYRKENAKPRLHLDDPNIVAIAADVRFDTKLPQFDLNDIDGVADFILRFNGFKT